MANSKISALPSATTPLAGAEVLPIVQGGITEQVSVANLTAGRTVSAASLSLTTTPLAVTSGGTGTATAFTAGSVVFAGASGVYSQDNTNFFWDDTNNRLGVGTTTVNADGIEISKLTGRATPVPVELRLTSSDNGTGWSTTLPWARLSFYDSDTSLGGPKLAASIETIMDAVAGGYSSVYIKTQDTSGSPYALKTAVKIDGAQDVTVSNGNLIIGTSGKGIDFSATAGTGTSELLADYEEGTFTPFIKGTTTAGTGTYTLQVGSYTKIGNRVFFNIYIAWTAHTGTGAMSLDGLPFTIANNNNAYAAVATYMETAITLTAGSIFQMRTSINSTQLLLAQYASGGGNAATIAMDTNAGIMLQGHYYV